MKGLQFKFFCLCLIAVMLSGSGCVTMKEKKRIEDLEMQVSGLTRTIRDKDRQLQRCQELLSDMKMQLQRLDELQNELDECRARLESFESLK